MNSPETGAVLIIYTGGTIGSLRKDPGDPLSPLEPASLEAVLRHFPAYDPDSREIVLGRGRVRLGTVAFDPPLDSSDIVPGDWVRMAQLVDDHYEDYDGFVILHGTDTLAYTSSALAFILRNLRKPVVVTGSQRPIGEVRSDAEQNLITAVEIAAARTLGFSIVPEVCVFFRDHLFRGCRTAKYSATSYEAFISPNHPPLGTAGQEVVIDDDLIRRARPGSLELRKRFEHHVASLDIFPGMPAELLRKLFRSPGLKGVVLRTFGIGNAPSSPPFLAAIAEAVERGIVVMNATQCMEGEVRPGRYSASAGLLARGVIGSLDMTREAALAKMFVVLGEESDPAVAADTMQLDLAGEQRLSLFQLHFPAGSAEPGNGITAAPVRPMVGRERFRPDAVEDAMLRITGLRLLDRDAGTIRFRAALDGGDGELAELGEVTRAWGGDPAGETVLLPVTRPVKERLDPAGSVRLALTNLGDAPLAWSRLNLACSADVEIP